LSQSAWTLDAFILNGALQSLPENDSITLTILPQQHLLAGSDGCNSYGATYSAFQGHLRLSHFYFTTAMCLGPRGALGSRYQLAFSQVTSYQFDWTGLRLRDDNGTVLLHY